MQIAQNDFTSMVVTESTPGREPDPVIQKATVINVEEKKEDAKVQ